MSDASLKLAIGLAIGVFVYAKYKKGMIKQEKMSKDIRIGRQIPFEKGEPIVSPMKTMQKQNHSL